MPTPAFPIGTYSVWNNKLDDSLGNQVLNKAQELYDAGKTDNVVDQTFGDFVDPPGVRMRYVRRSWVDTEAANEWVSFIQSLSSPCLISITVE